MTKQMTKLIAFMITVFAVTGDAGLAAQRSVVAHNTVANTSRATVSRAATDVVARVANQQSQTAKSETASHATNVVARTATAQAKQTQPNNVDARNVSARAAVSKATTNSANTASRSGTVANALSAVSRRIQSAARSIRGRTGTGGLTTIKSGSSIGINKPGLSQVDLLIPEGLVDVYPDLGAYIELAGNRKVDGKWAISIVQDSAGLPSLKTLFTNIRYRGGNINGVFTGSTTSAEQIYNATGSVVGNASTTSNVAASSGEVYIVGATPTTECDEDGENGFVCEVSEAAPEADNGCPSGLKNSIVRAAMLRLNGIEEESEAAEHPESWDWQYERTFNADPSNTSEYPASCKLIVRDKIGLCWTNGGQSARGGLFKDSNTNEYYYAITKNDRYPNNWGVVPVIVDCNIDTFHSEYYSNNVNEHPEASHITLSYGDPLAFGPIEGGEPKLHVETCDQSDVYNCGPSLPPLAKLVSAMKGPAYTTQAGLKLRKTLKGIFDNKGVQYYDKDGIPIKMVANTERLGAVGSPFSLSMKWEEPDVPPVDQGTGCPSYQPTLQAWEMYEYGPNGGPVASAPDGASEIRVVKGKQPAEDISDCAIIFKDADGVCRLAKWNTKTNKGYGDCADSRTGTPSVVCASDPVVYCGKTNSNVDAELMISSDVSGFNTKYGNMAYEWFLVGVEYGAPLPSLKRIVEMNNGTTGYDRGAVFMGAYNKEYSIIGGGIPRIPNGAELYWDETGEPTYRKYGANHKLTEVCDKTNNTCRQTATQAIYDKSEFDYDSIRKTYGTKLYWDHCNLQGGKCTASVEYCPVPDIPDAPSDKMKYNGYYIDNADKEWVKTVTLSFMSWVKSVEDCGVITKDADGQCWLSSNERSSHTSVHKMVDCEVPVSSRGYLKDSSHTIKLLVDNENGKITSRANTSGISSMIISIPSDVGTTSSTNHTVVLPNLQGLVQNMTYSKPEKVFAGAYSKPNGTGIKYYENDGTKTQEWRCYGAGATCRFLVSYASEGQEAVYGTVSGSEQGTLIGDGTATWEHMDRESDDYLWNARRIYMHWVDAD